MCVTPFLQSQSFRLPPSLATVGGRSAILGCFTTPPKKKQHLLLVMISDRVFFFFFFFSRQSASPGILERARGSSLLAGEATLAEINVPHWLQTVHRVRVCV